MNTADSIRDVLKAVDALNEFWKGQGVGEDDLSDLAIVAEEMISNVVRHGGASVVEVRISWEEGQATIEIEDDGVEFNPAAYPQANISGPLEERRVGGLGILMVRRMMDVVEWQRKDGRNLFRMSKHCRAG